MYPWLKMQQNGVIIPHIHVHEKCHCSCTIGQVQRNHAHSRDYAMEEVAWSGNQLLSKDYLHLLSHILLFLAFLLGHLWLWNDQMLSSYSFLKKLGSAQTSCLDATRSWPRMEENESWQTKCVKSLVPGSSHGGPLRVINMLSWSQSFLDPQILDPEQRENFSIMPS